MRYDHYVLVNTEEEYNTIMSSLHDSGYHWASGDFLKPVKYWHLYDKTGGVIVIHESKKAVRTRKATDLDVASYKRDYVGFYDYMMSTGWMEPMVEDDVINDLSSIL